MPVDQCRCILIAAEPRPFSCDIVSHDQIEAFRCQLGLCVSGEIARLSGKADHELRRALSRESRPECQWFVRDQASDRYAPVFLVFAKQDVLGESLPQPRP